MEKKKAVKVFITATIFLSFIFIAGFFSFKPETPKGKTIEERLSFATSFGWEVDEKSEVKDEITIPNEFGEVFENYNEMQVSQGFNLKKYKGKTVARYRMKILNHPKEKTHAFINILVYKGKIIGGEVFSPKINGFLEQFNTCYNKK